jgi:hypothetical protein
MQSRARQILNFLIFGNLPGLLGNIRHLAVPLSAASPKERPCASKTGIFKISDFSGILGKLREID